MADGSFLSSSWYRVARLRPRLREHVTIQRHRYRGGVWHVLHDHATGRLHRLAPGSYLIVGTMDGTQTVDELWHAAIDRLGHDAPSQDEFVQLLAQLHASDLMQMEVTPDSTEILERASAMQRSRWSRNVLYPLALQIRLWHPDKFFDRTAPFVNWLFSWRGTAIWMAVIIPAFTAFIENWQALSENAAGRILATDNLVMLALSYPVLKALHELGHGYAVKAFGGVVHEIGVMFLVFAPVPYVDASAASEFRSKWQRMIVGAAGMMVEVFIASLALFVWLAVEPGIVRTLAYNVMLISGISTVLFNGNPLLRYDG
jgi:putative peptide zinc metalloprotease protein